MASETVSNHQEKALALLQADAEKILRLIKVQMDHLTMPQCPLYEEVLDTQMFGLSREVDFAVRLGLIAEEQGKAMLGELERELSALHEAFTNKQRVQIRGLKLKKFELFICIIKQEESMYRWNTTIIKLKQREEMK